MGLHGAPTIKAAVRQAGSTTASELSTQGFTGPVQSHTRVARRDTGFRREVADAKAIEVHPPDGRSILGLESLDQA
jgi:hypothetical protein